MTTARTTDGHAMLIRRIGHTNHHNEAFDVKTDEDGYLAYGAETRASYWTDHHGVGEFHVGRHDMDFHDAHCGHGSHYNT